MVSIHDFEDNDAYPWNWEFLRENAKNCDFLVLLARLSNHNIPHIYRNLAVLLTCMMYYMRLCNVEYNQGYRSYF